MLTQHDIPAIVERVNRRLLELSAEFSAPVELDKRDYHLDDDWLYLMVTPPKAGTRASDYAMLMGRIEKELRADGIDNVVLLPVLAELV